MRLLNRARNPVDRDARCDRHLFTGADGDTGQMNRWLGKDARRGSLNRDGLAERSGGLLFDSGFDSVAAEDDPGGDAQGDRQKHQQKRTDPQQFLGRGHESDSTSLVSGHMR